MPRKIDTSFPGRIKVYVKDSVAENNAKPKGIRGAEMCWNMMDHPPLSRAELIHSAFSSSNCIVLTFDESDRGKRIYFTLRWESTSDKKGGFSIIYSVIVP